MRVGSSRPEEKGIACGPSTPNERQFVHEKNGITESLFTSIQ